MRFNEPLIKNDAWRFSRKLKNSTLDKIPYFYYIYRKEYNKQYDSKKPNPE
jgi:hypothetical protein